MIHERRVKEKRADWLAVCFSWLVMGEWLACWGFVKLKRKR